VSARLASCEALAGAERIALYAPLPDELSTSPLLASALAAGKHVLWPRLSAEGVLELAAAAPNELVRDGAGFLAPPLDEPAVALSPADVVIVPGVGFTRAGDRLGRGGGHYDRLLAHCAAASIGVAFDIQLVGELPTEPHDRGVDLVVTPGGMWRRAR